MSTLPSPYRHPGESARCPGSIRERRTEDATVFEIRHYVGGARFVAASASSVPVTALVIAQAIHAGMGWLQSAVAGLACSGVWFFVALESAKCRDARLELFRDRVRAGDVTYRFADFPRFDVAPDRTAARRRLVSWAEAGDEVTVLRGLLPEQAEYLCGRVERSINASTRTGSEDTSLPQADSAREEVDAKPAVGAPPAAEGFEWSRFITHVLTATAIYLVGGFVFSNELIAGMAALVAIVFALVHLLIGIGEKARWRVRYGAAVAALYLAMVAGTSFTVRVQNATAQARAERIVAALERYRADHGTYPDRLTDLAPTYLPSVPRAKDFAVFGDFVYVSGGRHCDGILLWTVVPPFGRRLYDFRHHEWRNVD